MTLTPHNQLQQWLILALGEMGGSASRAGALARIEATFGLYFTADDLDSPPSRPFETKWRNRVSWQRDRMVKGGLLLPFEGYGTPWRLSDSGRLEYEAVRHESSPSDSLANFRPKDSSDYRAHVEGRELIKRRSHEALIADFGAWYADLGRNGWSRRRSSTWAMRRTQFVLPWRRCSCIAFFCIERADPNFLLSSASQLVTPTSRFWTRTTSRPCGARMTVTGGPRRLRLRSSPVTSGSAKDLSKEKPRLSHSARYVRTR
jgi:hypothetical protein